MLKQCRLAVGFLTLVGFCFTELMWGAESPDLRRPKAIKIATIGALPPPVASNATPDMVVDHVINHWRGRFAQVLPDRPDLIVVPENCDRPSGLSGSRQFEYYLGRGNRVREYFAQVATENHCYITYPATRPLDDGTWRNSIALLDRTGQVAGIYDKNHPTIGEIESGILPGAEAPIIECDFGRVALAICFDLNFDVLRAQYAKASPDLVIFCSMYHGGLMQSYWAYSCRSYFVGAIERRCRSEIRSPLGRVVASNTNYFDYAVADVNLDNALVHLDYNWDRLKALKEKYGPAVTITDPGHLGAVMVASTHESMSADAMLDEFEMERLDDYLNRSLRIQKERVPPKEQ